MLEHEGYTSILTIRKRMETANAKNRGFLMARAVKDRLSTEARTSLRRSPRDSDQEAFAEAVSEATSRIRGMSDGELQAQYEYYLDDSRVKRLLANIFQQILRSQENYFLCGPGKEPHRASRHILTSRFSDDGRVFDFLSDEFLTVSVSDRLEDIRAIKTLKASSWNYASSRATGARFNGMLRFEPAFKALLDFEGSSVCVPDNDAPTEKWIAEKLFSSNSEIQSSLGGRPRKQEAAAEAYSIEFPNGHSGYQWKEVINRLAVEHDVHVSIDTLKEAINYVPDTKNDGNSH